MGDKYKFDSTSIKQLNPEEYKDKIVTAADGIFGSVMQANEKFKWKKYDEDKNSNAVSAFLYWNNLPASFVNADKPEAKKYFKHSLKNVNKVINTFKTNLIKLSTKYKSEYMVDLYYDQNQGKWYDGELHFVDYLWTDVCEIVERKYSKEGLKVSWVDYPFVMTDDIYALSAMQNKKLTFQHYTPDKNRAMFSIYKKIITEAYAETTATHSTILKKKDIVYSKSKVIIFEFK